MRLNSDEVEKKQAGAGNAAGIATPGGFKTAKSLETWSCPGANYGHVRPAIVVEIRGTEPNPPARNNRRLRHRNRVDDIRSDGEEKAER